MIDPLPIWMLLSAALGFLAGQLCGNLASHRRSLQQVDQDLSDQVKKLHDSNEQLYQAVRQNRKVINDTHKRLFGP